MKSCIYSLNLIKGNFLCPRVVTWRTRCSGMVLLPGGRAAHARAALFPQGWAERARGPRHLARQRAGVVGVV